MSVILKILLFFCPTVISGSCPENAVDTGKVFVVCTCNEGFEPTEEDWKGSAEGCKCQESKLLSRNQGICITEYKCTSERYGIKEEQQQILYCKCNQESTYSNGKCVCDNDEVISIDGQSCISQTACFEANGILTADNKKCKCNAYSTYSGGKCVCNDNGQVISIDGESCISEDSCKNDYFGILKDETKCECNANSDYSNGKCVCDNDEVISIDGQSCISQTACFEANGILTADNKKCKCNAYSTYSGGKCVCNDNGQVISIDGESCISEDACTDDYYGILINDDSKCECNTASSYSGENENKKCVCTNDEVISIDGESCISEDNCKDVYNGILTADNKKCKCNTESSPNSDGKCVCKENGKVISIDRESCILPNSCTNEKYGILKNEIKCDCNDDSQYSGEKCVCQEENNVISIDRTVCIPKDQCDAVISLDKIKCIPGDECNDETKGFSEDNNECECKNSDEYVLGVDKNSCINKNDCTKTYNGELTEEGTKCECNSGSQYSTSSGKCVCNDNGKVISIDGESCISEDACKNDYYGILKDETKCECNANSDYSGGKCVCDNDEVISINGQSCISKDSCTAANGILTEDNKKCICNAESSLNSEGKCVCKENDKVISIDGKSCILQNSCTNEKYGIVKDETKCECNDDSQYSGEKCVCKVANNVISIDRTVCIPKGDCTKNYYGKDPEDEDTACDCNSDSTYSSSFKKCQCNTANNVIYIDGKSCILNTQCRNYNGKLTEDNKKCECNTASSYSKEKGKCVCNDNENNVISIDRTECILRDDCTNVYYGKYPEDEDTACDCNSYSAYSTTNHRCECSSSSYYISLDGTSCVRSCSGGGTASDKKCKCPTGYSVQNGVCTCDPNQGYTLKGETCTCDDTRGYKKYTYRRKDSCICNKDIGFYSDPLSSKRCYCSGSTKIQSLDGTTCILRTACEAQDQKHGIIIDTDERKQCMCDEDNNFEYDKTNDKCICKEDYPIQSLDGTKCIINADCTDPSKYHGLLTPGANPNKCICDTGNGYTMSADGEKCECDPLRGYKKKDNEDACECDFYKGFSPNDGVNPSSGCSCDSERKFTSDGPGQCKCEGDLVISLNQTRCIPSDQCGYGTRVVDGVCVCDESNHYYKYDIGTDFVCKCNYDPTNAYVTSSDSDPDIAYVTSLDNETCFPKTECAVEFHQGVTFDEHEEACICNEDAHYHWYAVEKEGSIENMCKCYYNSGNEETSYVKSIKGDGCILKTACTHDNIQGAMLDTTYEPQEECICNDDLNYSKVPNDNKCECKPGTHVFSLDKTECITIEKCLEIDGDPDGTNKNCICDTDNKNYEISTDNQKCVCRTDKQDETYVIHLDEEMCITEAECKSDTVKGIIESGFCKCDSHNAYVKSLDKQTCITEGDCHDLNGQINPYGGCECDHEKHYKNSPDNQKCICDTGYVLSLDEKSCIPDATCTAIPNAKIKVSDSGSNCECVEGYTTSFTGDSCISNTECNDLSGTYDLSNGKHCQCDDSNYITLNEEKSKCVCYSGYVLGLNRIGCIPKDECNNDHTRGVVLANEDTECVCDEANHYDEHMYLMEDHSGEETKEIKVYECKCDMKNNYYTSLDGLNCILETKCTEINGILGTITTIGDDGKTITEKTGDCICDTSNEKIASLDGTRCIDFSACTSIDHAIITSDGCRCDNGYLLSLDQQSCFTPDECNAENGVSGINRNCICNSERHYTLDSNTYKCVCDQSTGFTNDDNHLNECICSDPTLFLSHDGKSCITEDECITFNGNMEEDVKKCQCLSKYGYSIDPEYSNCTCDSLNGFTYDPETNKCVCVEGFEQNHDYGDKCVCINLDQNVASLDGKSCMTKDECTSIHGESDTDPTKCQCLSGEGYTPNLIQDGCECDTQRGYKNSDDLTECICNPESHVRALNGSRICITKDACVASNGEYETEKGNCKCDAAHGYTYDSAHDECVCNNEPSDDGDFWILSIDGESCIQKSTCESLKGKVGTDEQNKKKCICDSNDNYMVNSENDRCICNYTKGFVESLDGSICITQAQCIEANGENETDFTKCTCNDKLGYRKNADNVCICNSETYVKSLSGDSCIVNTTCINNNGEINKDNEEYSCYCNPQNHYTNKIDNSGCECDPDNYPVAFFDETYCISENACEAYEGSLVQTDPTDGEKTCECDDTNGYSLKQTKDGCECNPHSHVRSLNDKYCITQTVCKELHGKYPDSIHCECDETLGYVLNSEDSDNYKCVCNTGKGYTTNDAKDGCLCDASRGYLKVENSYECECNTELGYKLNNNENDCVCNFDEDFIRTLDGSSCITKGACIALHGKYKDTLGTDEEETSCECNGDNFYQINSNKDGCVCISGKIEPLSGEQCITPDECTALHGEYRTDPTRCQCDALLGRTWNPETKLCECNALLDYIKSIDGETCIQKEDCLALHGEYDTDATQCKCETPNYKQNGNTCDCNDNDDDNNKYYWSLINDRCIDEATCTEIPHTKVTETHCECDPDGGFSQKPGDEQCECNPETHVLSLDHLLDNDGSCISKEDCIAKHGEYHSEPTQCTCDLDGFYVLDKTSHNCICNPGTHYMSIDRSSCLSPQECTSLHGKRITDQETQLDKCECNDEEGYTQKGQENSCECDSSKSYVLSIDGKSCMLQSVCESKNGEHSTDTTKCTCDTSKGYRQKGEENSCECDSSREYILSIGGDSCILETECTTTYHGEYSTDPTQCTCDASKGYIKGGEDGKTCVCNEAYFENVNGKCVCKNANEVISLDGTTCILKTDCTNTYHGEIETDPTKCQCKSYDGYSLNINTHLCECDSEGGYIPNGQDGCKCDAYSGYILNEVTRKCDCNTEKGFQKEENSNNCKCKPEQPYIGLDEISCISEKTCVDQRGTKIQGNICTCQTDLGYVNNGESCECDATKGYIYDEIKFECVCDSLRGYKQKPGTHECECDPERYVSSLDGKRCVSKTDCTQELIGTKIENGVCVCNSEKYFVPNSDLSACECDTNHISFFDGKSCMTREECTRHGGAKVDDEKKACDCNAAEFYSKNLDKTGCECLPDSHVLWYSKEGYKCIEIDTCKSYHGWKMENGNCKCDSSKHYIQTEEKDNCECEENYLTSLEKNSCIPKEQCENPNTNTKISGKDCVCTSDSFFVGLDGENCITQAFCTNKKGIVDEGACKCDDTNFYSVKPDKTRCECFPETHVESLDGNSCITKDYCKNDIKGAMIGTEEEDLGKCICDSNRHYTYNQEENECECEENYLISLDENGCLHKDDCVDTNIKGVKIDVENLKCICNSENGYTLNSDKNGCKCGTVKNNEGQDVTYVKSLDGESCITEDECETIPNALPFKGACKCDSSRGYTFTNGECKLADTFIYVY